LEGIPGPGGGSAIGFGTLESLLNISLGAISVWSILLGSATSGVRASNKLVGKATSFNSNSLESAQPGYR